MKQVIDFLQKPNFPQLEEEVLRFWDHSKTFEKSIAQRSKKNPYIFYDGPPFATGLPHYGHLLASTIKDVIPRYWTMKGYRVERVWGWDCHGIPIENIIEQQLKLKGGKKGIETMGIGKFNAACRSAILRFDKEWEKVIHRLGRWVDFTHSYKTMDNSYMESVWWAFSELYRKGNVYKGRKVILYCPRCATPLSNFEIAMDNSYKDVADNSVFVKFKLCGSANEYLLAWTTTPWTLVGNVALAVDKKADYVLVSVHNQKLWIAKKLVKSVFPHDVFAVEKTVKGKELVGLKYEPLYSFMPLNGKKAYYITSADFVSLDDGTGIVHTAAIFGEDDYALAKKHHLPCVPTLDDEGKFLPFVTPIAGVFYKKAENWIIQDLSTRSLLYKVEKTVHSYPFCYRCATPLYYNAVPAWFIDVKKLKPALKKGNESIHWYPAYLKYGRFGKGLESAPDWNISRSRYWGTPMPVWVGEKTGKLRVLGSFQELKTWAVDTARVEKLTDYHREFLDDLEVWVDDEKTEKGKRIPEVFDCWVESGSMPYASIHYPFEHKKTFEARYPAQFISEYIAQTRAWFYTLHVMSTGLFGQPAFENAITTGTILAEDGSKMSKSKRNFPDPMLLINTYGVDSLRLFLMSSSVMKSENINFSEQAVNELRKKVFGVWWNVFAFYKLYAKQEHPLEYPDFDQLEHVMDRWIVSGMMRLVQHVTKEMDAYDVVSASKLLIEFVSDLSTWYLRESRERLRDADTNAQASQVFGTTLYYLTLLFSPFTPFFSEVLYQHFSSKKCESIHLENWPTVDVHAIHPLLESRMKLIRKAAERIHALRKAHGIKTRQPLAKAVITAKDRPKDNLLEILKQEVNVEQVNWITKESADGVYVQLDTVITKVLEKKGAMRDTIRRIQDLRKIAGVSFDAMVSVQLRDWPKEYEKEIKKKTLVNTITKGTEEKVL